MSQKSSLPQSAESVSWVLTADKSPALRIVELFEARGWAGELIQAGRSQLHFRRQAFCSSMKTGETLGYYASLARPEYPKIDS